MWGVAMHALFNYFVKQTFEGERGGRGGGELGMWAASEEN